MVIKNKLQKGFTLIEMIVVVAIVGVISATVMFNYSDFRQGIDVRNVAQEIALSIRKAQTYATASKGIYDKNGAKIKAFGMVFSSSPTNVGGGRYKPYAKSFMLYAGVPFTPAGATKDQYTYTNLGTANCDPNMFGILLSTQCLESFGITSPVSITKVELYNNGAWTEIAPPSQLQIIFYRPTPDASICKVTGFVATCDGNAGAKITIASQNAKVQKEILVWNTGQISVNTVQVSQSTGGLDCYPGDPRIECASEVQLGNGCPLGAKSC